MKKVFNIYLGYGYWVGNRVFFVGRRATRFAIIPMFYIVKDTTYADGKRVEY